jgi:hypothetical protein
LIGWRRGDYFTGRIKHKALGEFNRLLLDAAKYHASHLDIPNSARLRNLPASQQVCNLSTPIEAMEMPIAVLAGELETLIEVVDILPRMVNCYH